MSIAFLDGIPRRDTTAESRDVGQDKVILKIFVDESSQNGHDHLVLGGIIVHENRIEKVLTELANVRSAHQMQGEIKWRKVSKSKLSAYMDFIDCFFSNNSEDVAHFHSLIVDTRRFDLRYRTGDSEVGFSKCIYQLLLKFGRSYHHIGPLHVHLDQRTTKQSLEELRRILNNGIRKRWQVSTVPYRRVQFLDSKHSDLLQAVDLLIGAIAYVKNGHHQKNGASAARIALAEHIRSRAAVSNLGATTSRSRETFTIWNFQPMAVT